MKKSKTEIKEAVKKHYGEAIGRAGCCCGSDATGSSVEDLIANSSGYKSEDLSGLPDGITSFGCGNPLSLARVRAGDVVLDLGSGAGLDLILAAKKVGPEGKVIGVDMTPQMIATCRENLKKAGIVNAEVRRGEMEALPVADGEVDWIISNCVVNLSPEKEKVFAEAYRVLKPGGQLLISDIVTNGLPDEVRGDMAAWVSCIAGAIEESEFVRLLREAGFDEVEIVARHEYSSELAGGEKECSCGESDGCCGHDGSDFSKYAGKIASVKVYAKRN